MYVSFPIARVVKHACEVVCFNDLTECNDYHTRDTTHNQPRNLHIEFHARHSTAHETARDEGGMLRRWSPLSKSE
jgi:hypothetical protein